MLGLPMSRTVALRSIQSVLIDRIESEFSEAGLKTGIGFKVLSCEMILLTHNWIILIIKVVFCA